MLRVGFEPTPFRTRTLIWRLRPTRPSQPCCLPFLNIDTNTFAPITLRTTLETFVVPSKMFNLRQVTRFHGRFVDENLIRVFLYLQWKDIIELHLNHWRHLGLVCKQHPIPLSSKSNSIGWNHI